MVGPGLELCRAYFKIGDIPPGINVHSGNPAVGNNVEADADAYREDGEEALYLVAGQAAKGKAF
jgi:hypothetical protein